MSSIDRFHEWVARAVTDALKGRGAATSAPFTIGEVCQCCDLSRPAVTRHLRKMVDDGHLGTMQVGKMYIFWRTGE